MISTSVLAQTSQHSHICNANKLRHQNNKIKRKINFRHQMNEINKPPPEQR